MAEHIDEKSGAPQAEETPYIESHQPQQEDLPDQTAQDGVRIAEAMTMSWSRTSLIVVYIRQFFPSMWLLYFSNAFESQLENNLNPYVSSAFEDHSLMPVINVVSSTLSGVTYMPVAKVLNLCDRTVGFISMISIATLGMVLMASCNSFPLYAAAQVFYSIGFTGMIFCVDVVTSDTSTMQNRGLAFAFTSSTYIITAFAGPAAAEKIYGFNWRWGYGAWAIVVPAVSVPMVVVMQLGKRKAMKNGLMARPRSNRTWYESIWHYMIEFDFIGVFLVCAGFVIFLLPFTLAGYSEGIWSSAYIIAMIVVGFVLLVAFAFWERYGARKPFVPWYLLKSRTVLGACLLDFTYQVAYYCWYLYLTSYLQVVYNTSIESAGYISSIFDVVSSVELIAVGFLIRWTGHFKWILLWGVPLYMLGEGLMIYFRNPGWGIGYMILCQVIIALGGGVITIGEQVAVLAASDHNDVAAVLALLGLVGYIGGSVGSSISGAIWTNTLPGELRKMLSEKDQDKIDSIVGSLPMQLSYPMGSEMREVIGLAYAATQKRMLIAGTAIMALGLGFTLLIKNINVKKVDQVKGMVF
ncbi:siderophore iron transporter mirB [Penicillium riverlandense]|uniref:siderophore iron transporter mirB n=1 Tax=Penicillium riverlandense TaxID=1903569 RepID=UPI002549607D|nr:siderophore iron transporter mirB [Penicillium riverlandense]KAJ5815251.1 siderophore iron transporter mirB [Penicillium riverlandense]